jgi:hypothetical protein
MGDSTGLPPYTDADDPKNGLQCYMTGCKYTATTWRAMLLHLRQKHDLKIGDVTGTVLHVNAKREENQMARERYEKKKRERRTSPCDDDVSSGQSSSAVGWRKMLCWVKCTDDDIPVEPFECRGVVAAEPVPMQPDDTGREDTAASACTVDDTPSRRRRRANAGRRCRAGTDVADDAGVADGADRNASSGVHSTQSMQSQESSDATTIQMGHGSSTGRESATSDLLEEMKALRAALVPDKAKWMESIPVVKVKERFLNDDGPPAKDDSLRRATWPKKFKGDAVKIDGFVAFLEKHLNKAQPQVVAISLHAGRFLGAFEVVSPDGAEVVPITDVMALIGIYTSNAHQQFIDAALMKPVYTWSIKMLDAFILYCKFHLRGVNSSWIKGGCGYWNEYTNVITALITDTGGGHKKRCQRHKREYVIHAAARMLREIKDMPTVQEMQLGVWNGYVTLRRLEDIYGGCDVLPKTARRLANVCVIGGIIFDTFAGRTREWRYLNYWIAKAVLDGDDINYFTCSAHKTFLKYGEIAKWISPGLKQCLRCYMKFGRPEGVNTFLVGAGKPTSVNIHKLLEVFVKYFLPANRVRPTATMMRKWYHTHLMKLTDSKEKLKEVMTVIDAHSALIQERHYCLKDPADDAKLAELLVRTVVGPTVMWPQSTQAQQQALAGVPTIEDVVSAFTSGRATDDDDSGDSDVEDVDSEEEDMHNLEWWPHGEVFGIYKLGEYPHAIEDVHNDTMPICDAEDVGAVDLSLESQTTSSSSQSIAICNEDRSKSSGASRTRITKEKAALYAGYVDKSNSNKRMKVDSAAHRWMEARLQRWQAENGLPEHEWPTKKEWYLDARVDAIDAQVLTRQHSEDVVRSYLKHYCTKRAAINGVRNDM